MTDPSPRLRELLPQAAGAIWRNRWTRALLIIFAAFEIYNTAILPAVRGTLEVRKLKAETDAATSTLQDFRSSAPPSPTSDDDVQYKNCIAQGGGASCKHSEEKAEAFKQWDDYYSCRAVQLGGRQVTCDKPSLPDPYKPAP